MTARCRSLPTSGPDQPEAGMTLIELVVTLTIMGLVMAMATAGLLPMYRIVNDTDLQSQTQSNLSQAMSRLDRQVRYAVNIFVATDGRSAQYLAVEPGATLVCYELHWSAGLLQQRSWTASGTRGATWSTLASGLRADRAGFTRPFTLAQPTDDIAYQRLQIKLVASAGDGRAERNSDVTFTALNTDTDVGNTCLP